MDIYIFFSESQLCLGIGVARREAAWMRADSRDYRFADPFSFYIFDLCKEGETNCLSFFVIDSLRFLCRRLSFVFFPTNITCLCGFNCFLCR